MHIVILYSLPSKRLEKSEFSVAEDDTEVTARIIETTCRDLGMTVELFPLSADHPECVLEIRGDCIVNLIEWTGSDIKAAQTAYQLLDTLEIPYTGANWRGFFISSEKMLMKKKFEEENIPSPKSITIPYTVQTETQISSISSSHIPSKDNIQVPFPCIIKLASDHCSIGLERDSVVFTQKQLNQRVSYMMHTFHQDILVEEFIEGREFQITALEQNGTIEILPFIEIRYLHPEKLNFLTFGGRWDENNPDYYLSEMVVAKNIPRSIEEIVEKNVKKMIRHFGMYEYVRFDVRTRGEDVYFLEVNANPGLDDSLECGVTRAAHAAGISFASLIKQIIISAVERKKKHKRMQKKLTVERTVSATL